MTAICRAVSTGTSTTAASVRMCEDTSSGVSVSSALRLNAMFLMVPSGTSSATARRSMLKRSVQIVGRATTKHPPTHCQDAPLRCLETTIGITVCVLVHALQAAQEERAC